MQPSQQPPPSEAVPPPAPMPQQHENGPSRTGSGPGQAELSPSPATPAPPASQPNLPHGAYTADNDTGPEGQPYAMTLADAAAQEAILKQAARDLTVSLLGGSSNGAGRHVSEFEVQQAVNDFQTALSSVKNPCTPAQLVKVVDGVRSLAALMDDPALTTAAQKHSLMQLVHKRTQRQAMYLESLSKVWSSPEPRCSLTSMELLPHIQALGGWYVQIYQELKAASKQGAVARLLSRSKTQAKFAMYERVLAEHGDIICDSISPDNPAVVAVVADAMASTESSPEIDRQLKQAADDMAAGVEGMNVADKSDTDKPATSQDLLAFDDDHHFSTPTKSRPSATAMAGGAPQSAADAAQAAAAAAASPADPFGALAAAPGAVPRNTSNPFMSADADAGGAAGAPSRQVSSVSAANPFAPQAPTGYAAQVTGGAVAPPAPTNANPHNPFAAMAPVEAAAACSNSSSSNPFGMAMSAQSTPSLPAASAPPSNFIRTYTYQPTGWTGQPNGAPSPAPSASLSATPAPSGSLPPSRTASAVNPFMQPPTYSQVGAGSNSSNTSYSQVGATSYNSNASGSNPFAGSAAAYGYQSQQGVYPGWTAAPPAPTAQVGHVM